MDGIENRGDSEEYVAQQKRLAIAKAWTHAELAILTAFGPKPLSGPMWNMLLDLYVKNIAEAAVCISDLFTVGAAPPTTILRYVTVLEKRSLIRRSPDTADKRRIHLSLTDEGVQRVEHALDLAAMGDRRLGIGRLAYSDQVDNRL